MDNQNSRETGNIGYTRRKKNKKQTEHNVCWTPLCTHIIYKMLENTEWTIKIQEKLAT